MSAAATTVNSIQAYTDHVNPQWVRLLSLLQMQTEYSLCSGAELHTAAGEVILDFLSGYCVHNTGHNHPAIIEALHAELDHRGPVMCKTTFAISRANWPAVSANSPEAIWKRFSSLPPAAK